MMVSTFQPALGLFSKTPCFTKLYRLSGRELLDGATITFDLVIEDADFVHVHAWRYDGTTQLYGVPWFKVEFMRNDVIDGTDPYRTAGLSLKSHVSIDPEQLRSPAPIDSEHGWWRDEFFANVLRKTELAQIRVSCRDDVPEDALFNLWIKYSKLVTTAVGAMHHPAFWPPGA